MQSQFEALPNLPEERNEIETRRYTNRGIQNLWRRIARGSRACVSNRVYPRCLKKALAGRANGAAAPGICLLTHG
jgi:hypothetical protein